MITADKLTFDDIDVMRADEDAMRRIRGKRAGLILQDPKYSLNPVMTAGEQIAEAWRVHRGGSRRLAYRAAIDLLTQVQIRDPDPGRGGLSARAVRRHGPARDDRHDAGARIPSC